MLRRFKEWQIDLFAVPITLNRGGRKKANSRHGFFLTVLFAGFIIWTIYNLSRELFVRKNPNTISFESFVETPAPMELSKDSFPFAFGLQTPILQGLTFFKDESIYIPNVKIVIFKLIQESDGSITKERVLVPIQVEACTLEHFGESWSSFKDLPLSDLYCIKPNQPNVDKIIIEGIEDFTYYQGLNVAIQKCQASSGICKTDTEISDQLTGAWFNIFYTQSSINPQNFSHPNQRFRTTFTSMISPAIYKSAIVDMSHLKVISDDGWLLETNREQNYLKMNSPTEYLDLTPSTRGFLWNGVFQVSQVMTTYERKYTKLQTVLAQIQGSAATAILVLVIMLHPYSQVKFNETLINELFDVKMKKRDRQGKKIRKRKVKTNQEGGGDSPKNTQQQSQETKGGNERTPDGLETKFPVFESHQDNMEGLRSDRALLTTKNNEEKEISPDKMAAINKYVSTQSFKTLLCSIEENDGPGIPYYQKPPQTLDKNFFENSKGPQKLESQPATARKSNKGLCLTVEKPEKIKLSAPSEMVSNGPDSLRIMSDVSVREENENSSEEGQEDKNSGEKESPRDILTPPMSPQSNLINHESDDIKRDLVLIDMIGEEPREEDGENQDLEEEEYESSQINISIWEFILSYIRRTNKTKEKLEVLDKGMKNVRERMDILNIMKKFRELDKLKALLLEEDQLILFNAIPKAEIRAKETNVSSTSMSTSDLLRANSVSRRIIKRSTFIDINHVKQEQIRKSYESIQLKAKKSKLDSRLLQIYDDIMREEI